MAAMLSLIGMGLHREWRRVRRLGPAGFLSYYLWSPRRDLPVLCELFLWVRNWRAAWLSFKTGAPMPALRLRRGFTLLHEAGDQPLALLREVFTQRCYRRHIAEPARGVLIDIGANIGLVTLDWAARMPNVVIHAYEPDPGTFRTLKRNVEGNRFGERVRLYNEAVSGRAGELTLYRTGMSGTASTFAFRDEGEERAGAEAQQPAGGARQRAPRGLWFWTESGAPLRVPAVSFDEVVERAQRDGAVKLVKIDTEGAEVDILEGATPDTLVKGEQFVVEYHDPLRLGARGRCEAAFARAGFRCVARESAQLSGLGLLYAARQARHPLKARTDNATPPNSFSRNAGEGPQGGAAQARTRQGA
jgi:FkbM family methyltransferase